MRNLKLIIHREYLSKVKNKTFVVITFLSPLILVGMIALIAYLSMLSQEGRRSIAVHDQGERFLQNLESNANTKFVDFSHFSLETAKDSVAAKEYDGLLFIPKASGNRSEGMVFFSENAPDNSFLEHLETIISTEITNEKLKEGGIDLQQLADAETEVNIKIENFSGQRSSQFARYVKMFFGGAAGYLLMMFIIIYGNMVMRSVIEEKTNRIVEIIVSSVKPVQLMLGKIIGTTLAGATQFLIWVVLGSVLVLTVSAIFGMEMGQMMAVPQPGMAQSIADQELRRLIIDIARLPLLELAGYFIVYFVGGYLLYSSIYAAIGGAVDNETDTQQFMFPIIIPLMLAIYVGFFSVIQNPHGTVSTIFSMIPLTSPVVMLMRIPFGVPWWEIVLSILILVLSILACIWLAAKIYRVGILMYGKKPSYKELYKWLKY